MRPFCATGFLVPRLSAWLPSPKRYKMPFAGAGKVATRSCASNRSGGNVVIISMAYRLKNSKFGLFSEARKHNLLFCQRLYQVNGYAIGAGVKAAGRRVALEHLATGGQSRLPVYRVN